MVVVMRIGFPDGDGAQVVPVLERYFAVATITAASALVTEVVATSVLGAVHADAGGFFFADAAKKRHSSGHLFVRTAGLAEAAGVVAGCLESIDRQRCASLSTN